MVSIKEVRSSNDALSNSNKTLTAVFVGATSGIGLATLKAFAKHIPSPKTIIIGRNRSRFEQELQTLKAINPNGEYTFLEADISLIRNIDAVCDEIKKHVSSIDLLYTSQGYISFNGRENNADGLDNSISLRYYGRVRFTVNLVPLMSRHGRAISILAGGQEGKIDENDLDLAKNYSVTTSAAQFSTMMSLSYDYLAQHNPEKSFIHVFPGLVSTGLLGRSATGVLGFFFRYVVEPLLSLLVTSAEESGERMLYYGTNKLFDKGCWTLDADGTAKNADALVQYRERGMTEKIAEHNQRIFERATSV